MLIMSFPVMAQECQFQFDQNQINVNYTGNSITTFFNINVQRPSSGSPSDLCERVAFFFGTGNANSYQRKAFKNGHTLEYTLENISPNGTLKSINDYSSENEFLSTYIGLGENKIIQGLFKMPVQTMPGGPGHYQDVVNITVVGYKNTSAYRIGMTKQLVINIQTQTSMELSIVPVGAGHNSSSTSATLNFGELTTGKELGADLIVKSNTGYRVRVGSNENGNLKHSNQQSFIPYEFYFANSLTNLAGTNGNPVSVTTKSGGSEQAGDRYNMRVKIGNTTGKPQGQYADTILVSIIAN